MEEIYVKNNAYEFSISVALSKALDISSFDAEILEEFLIYNERKMNSLTFYRPFSLSNKDENELNFWPEDTCLLYEQWKNDLLIKEEGVALDLEKVLRNYLRILLFPGMFSRANISSFNERHASLLRSKWVEVRALFAAPFKNFDLSKEISDLLLKGSKEEAFLFVCQVCVFFVNLIQRADEKKADFRSLPVIQFQSIVDCIVRLLDK